MKRLLLTAFALVAGVILATASAATGARPTLSVRSTVPIVVDGRHFAARERVRITSSAGSVTVRASSAGSFTVTLTGNPSDRCGALRLRAVGTHGSIELVKLPVPACRTQRLPRLAGRVQ